MERCGQVGWRWGMWERGDSWDFLTDSPNKSPLWGQSAAGLGVPSSYRIVRVGKTLQAHLVPLRPTSGCEGFS